MTNVPASAEPAITGGSRPWLTPTAALGRTAPPRAAAGETRTAERTTVRYGYRIGELGLLVAERSSCELIPAPALARIPMTPAWLLGVANLRGALVPIFDLAALLGLATATAGPQRFALVFDGAEHAVGVPVGRAPSALPKLQPIDQLPPLPPAAIEDMTAAYSDGATLWLEFDHRRFFARIARQMSAASPGEST